MHSNVIMHGVHEDGYACVGMCLEVTVAHMSCAGTTHMQNIIGTPLACSLLRCLKPGFTKGEVCTAAPCWNEAA